MPVEIPGYYFDTEKNRYFKIEKAQTAPTAATWSTDSVKRRKLASSAAEEAQKRADEVKFHIKRHELSRGYGVTSGLLARQLGASSRQQVMTDDADLGAAAWANGLVDKGSIAFGNLTVPAWGSHMPCFYVAGEDAGIDTGAVYGAVVELEVSEEAIVGAYIHTDENERMISKPKSEDSPLRAVRQFHREIVYCPMMSSIKYHKPSHKILITSRECDHGCGIFFFSPPLSSGPEGQRHWKLGETNHYQRISIRHPRRDQWSVHQNTPAPPSSDLICVTSTNAGMLRVHSNETMAWVFPPTSGSADNSQDGNYKNNNRHKHRNSKFLQDVFDLDFQVGNHNVILSGGRQPKVWITDLRCPEAQWTSIPHASSVAHVRSVNPHQILVAGLQNSMSLYDLRFLGHASPSSTSANVSPTFESAAAASAAAGRNRYSWRPNNAKPILEFPGYRNEAHFHFGWDVCPELNVVASAQDNGTVKLFSLRSGRTLSTHNSGVVGLRRNGDTGSSSSGLGNIRTEAPIQAIQFQTLPGEKSPSLFLAEGTVIRKFSFGTTTLGAEE